MEAIIKVEDLTHTYGKGTPFERNALEHLNVTVEKGCFLGIMGHTGSGKSTFMQHLNGLLRPTEGRVLLDGQNIWDTPAKIRQVRFQVGLVFQYPEYQLFEETVFRDIAFGPKNMGLSAEEVKERVHQAAAFVGISEEQLQKSPFELSGGQKRRVAIAGVIAMQPKVLILDEPTAGLDPKGREEVLENLKTYHQATGSTLLLVSHSMEDLARYAEKLLVLQDGKLFLEGTPTEVFAHAEELTAAGLDVPQVTKLALALRKRGIPVNPACYTVEALKEELLRLKREGITC